MGYDVIEVPIPCRMEPDACKREAKKLNVSADIGSPLIVVVSVRRSTAIAKILSAKNFIPAQPVKSFFVPATVVQVTL